MEWICGVTYTHSGFCLRTIDGNQAEHVRPVKELQSVLASEGKHTKIRGNTSFADWRELSTEETDDLATELGFPTGCNGQSFYKFEVEDYRYIIPAGVLMCAMFRPFHGIARYLFAPQGLDNLCTPYGNCEKPELLFFVYLRGATGIQPDKAQGILNSLSWMHCFYSAKQMWSSVLLNAWQGKLSMTLPKGSFSFTGRGVKSSMQRVLISEIRLRLLDTNEAPLEAFSRHTSQIEFERSLHLQDKHRIRRQPEKSYPKDLSIPLNDGDWRLTDKEWEEVEPIISSKWKFTICPREKIDAMLHKASQGLPWTKVIDGFRLQTDSRLLRDRMKADGRWDALIARLSELRMAQQSE